mmetsp:Transcript_6562/g.12282  ORF Transcript_6562/g.12282 Transcript_6562/m.12282 type:complete len:106 (+) Transcript_6562:1143-1460(+)
MLPCFHYYRCEESPGCPAASTLLDSFGLHLYCKITVADPSRTRQFWFLTMQHPMQKNNKIYHNHFMDPRLIDAPIHCPMSEPKTRQRHTKHKDTKKLYKMFMDQY